jgi:hypothetical protein
MSWRTFALLVALVVGSAGCGSATVGGTGKPASAKWVGPTVPSPAGGTMQTTIYYGPWQCSAAWMARCERQCASQGHALLGCIWLADIKGEWQERFAFFFPAEAGGRVAITHCCCDYPKVSDLAQRRAAWRNARTGFRNQWGREFGAWPQTAGSNWPGHHIFDLLHGGDPTAPANVLPMEPAVHTAINSAYPACYTRGAQWSAVGPDRPYVD